MADDVKNYQALLNGLAKQLFYKEINITNAYLKSELYPSLNDDEFDKIISKASSIIRNLASADMDFNQLEAFLVSQTKKREGALTENQASAFRKFWKTHKNKIHDCLIENANWNDSLKNFSWRIDVKSQSRNEDQINQPTAIMELQLANTSQNKNTVVQFEMDEDKLSYILDNMKVIEEEIKKYSQQ